VTRLAGRLLLLAVLALALACLAVRASDAAHVAKSKTFRHEGTAGRDTTSRDRPPLLRGEKPRDADWHNPTNRNLLRIARCETGYLPGRRPNWRHSNSTYAGALGFLHSTWRTFRHMVRPLPPLYAWQATPAEQLAVGRALVRTFGGYSSWPACSVRLGLR
jgi:hypothetical protein